MTQLYTTDLTRLSRHSVAEAGGKGANLGELLKAGIPVPAGFVVLSHAFETFLEETDIQVEIDAVLKHVKLADMNSIDRASHVIQGLIAKAQVPRAIQQDIAASLGRHRAKHFAVRSSATAEDSATTSWAGELETFLFIPTKDVVAHVQQCWASLFSPRAIFYRFEKKLHQTKVAVAVVVQEMADAKVAGVTFTVHPVTKDRNQMVIEACLGLGESLVSGLVTPDTYVLNRRQRKLLDVNIGEQLQQILPAGAKGFTKTVPVPVAKRGQQKLTEKRILELAAICERVEKHYRKPQDIEWVFDGKRFTLTQTRPITTL